MALDRLGGGRRLEPPRPRPEVERNEPPPPEPRGPDHLTGYDDPGTDPVSLNPEPREPTSAERARELFEDDVEGAIPDKPLEEWTNADAAAFTDDLAGAVEELADDPDAVTSLLTIAAPQLERSAQLLGRAGDEKGDRGEVEAMAANFSRIGNAAPEEASARLAAGLASQIDDDSELHYMDDGFQHFIDDGGDDSFRATLEGALAHQGRDEAADELIGQGGGGFSLNPVDIATSTFDALSGAAEGVAGAAWDFGGEVVDTAHEGYEAAAGFAQDQAHDALERANEQWQLGGDIVRGGVGFGLDVVDVGIDGIDAIAPDSVDGVLDTARDGVDLGRDGLEFHNRLQETVGEGAVLLGGTAVDAAHGVATDPVGAARNVHAFLDEGLDTLRLDDRVAELGPGDSFNLQAQLQGSVAGVNGELTGNIDITANEDGTYSMSVDGKAGAGVAAHLGTGVSGAGGAQAEASAMVEAGATVEFQFDSAEEATDAARTLMGPVAGGFSGLVDGGLSEALDGATPDLSTLTGNVQAVELYGGAAVEVAGSLGVGPEEFGVGANGSASASAQAYARIELNDDGPNQVAVGVRGEVSLAGAVGAGGGFGAPSAPEADPTRGDFGVEAPDLPSASASAGATGSVQVEHRFDLPEGLGADDLLRDPVGSVGRVAESVRDTGQLSVTLGASGQAGANASAGGRGVNAGANVDASVTLSGNPADILESGAVGAAFDGNFGDAFERLSPHVEVSASVSTSITTGRDATLAAGDGIDSLSIGLSSSTTDVQDPLVEVEGLTLEQARDELAGAFAQADFQVPFLA